MTPIADPFHPTYFDDSAMRAELVRVQSVCVRCRACTDHCGVFPSLFTMLDAAAGLSVEGLSREQQNGIVEQCFDCGLCTLGCPDAPGRGGHDIDHAALMRRAREVRVRDHVVPLGRRIAHGVQSATSRVGGLLGGRRSSARTRFSTWFRARPTPESAAAASSTSVAIFPTCVVEHSAPEIGRALVGIYEHNRVACDLPEGLRCCGAPLLHAGDVDGFVTQGRRTVRILADAVRSGRTIVSPQPTCTMVLTRDYRSYIGGSDAELVADHTFEATDHLMRHHLGSGHPLRMEFPGSAPESVTVHAPCHLRTQQVGVPAADLLALTGAAVQLAVACAGGSAGGGSVADTEVRVSLRRSAIEAIEAIETDRPAAVVVGECHAAAELLRDDLGRPIDHPLVVFARAYGLDPG